MGGFNGILLSIIIGVAFLLLWLAYRRVRNILGIKPHVIPDYERWVIYRDGQYNRLAGPGTETIRKRRIKLPNLDLIEYERVTQHINVRNQDTDIVIQGLLTHGIPYGYALNFWYRTDLEEAANVSHKEVGPFAQFNDGERGTHLTNKVRDALIASNQEIQADHFLQEDGEFFDKLIPILPGVELNRKMLKKTASILEESLPTIGMLFDSSHPIVITRILLSEEMISNFERGRTIELMQERLPDATKDDLLQMLSAIEGINMTRVHRMLFEERGQQKEMQQDITMDEGGEPKVRVRRYPSWDSRVEKDAGESATKSQDPVEEEEPYVMTDEDYRILKPIPPAA
ncbi:MAG: hypothetical protein H6642_00995 [Caldilineaceae bacterium]|nr:hypothetical protein [Caldilineaceae bacterium]